MRYVCFILAITLACLSGHPALAQTDSKNPVLEKIFADWKERQGSVKTARYVITGTTEFKDKDKRFSGESPIRPRRTVLLLDIERKRWRLETREDAVFENERKECTFLPRVGTTAFDGSALQHYYHRDLNRIENKDAVDLSIAKGQLQRGGSFDVHLYPVFFAHGIVFTGKDTELQAHNIPTTYDSDYFEVRGHLSLQDRSCTVLRTMPLPYSEPYYDELWIDMGEKSAIQRYVIFSGKNPWNRLDVKWKRTNLGFWPDQWTITWTVKGNVQRIHRLQVESFEANASVADGDFILEAKPGMKVAVADSRPPGPGLNPDLVPTRTYLISPSGSWQEISAKGYTTAEGIILPYERNHAWIWWVLAAMSAVTVPAFIYLLWRRKARVASIGINER